MGPLPTRLLGQCKAKAVVLLRAFSSGGQLPPTPVVVRVSKITFGSAEGFVTLG